MTAWSVTCATDGELAPLRPPTHNNFRCRHTTCIAGVISSSLGSLLKTQGLRVTSIKIDPYLNIDAVRVPPQSALQPVSVYACVVLNPNSRARALSSLFFLWRSLRSAVFSSGLLCSARRALSRRMSMVRHTFSMTVARWTSTLGTTSGSWTSRCTATTTSPPARFTR